MSDPKPRIVVFAGATATILNSAPLVTSNLTRRQYGLPLLQDRWGKPKRFDALRPQRLATPAVVYVEQFSAHPLERDAADLYAAPDGFIDAAGQFQTARSSDSDVPVFRLELRPEDGLIPLPYAARQKDGSPWDGDAVEPGADVSQSRQPFYPDASRLFEEIDRVGVSEDGQAGILSSLADFDFVRVTPPGGYRHGLAAAERTDLGEGDIPPEQLGEDYFPYRPPHLRREVPRRHLAEVTNRVQRSLAGGSYHGGLYLEGSPFIEETIYWLNLLIDCQVPLVGCASPDFPHGVVGAGGDRHIVDAVRYIESRIWRDDDGHDRIGAVIVSAEQVFSARDVQKADARPGGYEATGGHGGIVASTGEPGPPVLTYMPVWKHTHESDVRLSLLPERVTGVASAPSGLKSIDVAVRGQRGELLPDAIPFVSLHKHARYLTDQGDESLESEVELMARIKRNLERHPLAGIVLEGGSPYGHASPSADAALRLATFSGMPVVRASRGNASGFVAHERVKLGIAGSNLTATKARLLLMACLMRFGSLPPALDPANPTDREVAATRHALANYQRVFDSH